MNKSVRFGIIGTGSIAHKFASAIPSAVGAELIACASRTPGKAEKFAAEFGIPAAYNTYEALLANPDVDCVYIATTPNFHYENIMDCIRAGKHILCEKPLLSRASETAQVISAVRGTGLFLMEAMWTRFLPSMQKAREIVRSGELGRLLHLESHFCFQNPPTIARLYSRELEGSVTTDMGIYNYDITTFFTGCEPDQISTTPGVLYGSTDIEGNALLHFPGDVTAYLCCSYRFPRKNDFNLYLEKGSISLGPYFLNPERVEITRYDGGQERFDYQLKNGFEFEIEEAARCILAGRQESETHPWAAMLESARFFDHVFAAWGNPWPEK